MSRMTVLMLFSLMVGAIGAGSMNSDSALLCEGDDATCAVPSDETLGLMKALDSDRPSDDDTLAFIQASLHVQRRHYESHTRAGAGDPTDTSAESKAPAPSHLFRDKVVPIEYLQIMKKVFDRLNSTHPCKGGWTHGPVIVGGLSDSGTRGAQNLIKDLLNVTMQTADVVPSSGDDQIMNHAIARFWTSFLEHVDSISQDEYSNAPGFEQVADDLCDAIRQSWKLAGEPKGLWGFKSPRSILMTPIWNYLFNDGYRFVHVVRDPRAACAGKANKIQYDQVCGTLLSKAECAYPDGCFRYWAKVNGDVHQLYSKEGFQSRYVYMSMDRLVLPEATTNSASYRMLKQELGKLSSLDGGRTITADEPLIFKIMETERKYADSFKPTAFSESTKLRDALIQATDHDDVRQVMTCLGYDVADWGITTDYESI